MEFFNFLLAPTASKATYNTPPRNDQILSGKDSRLSQIKTKKKKDKSKKIMLDPNILFKVGWLKVSSKIFRNTNKYPPIRIPGKRIHSILIDSNDFRLNDLYKEGSKSIPHHRDFWFRLSGRLLYYSNTKEDINVLDSIYIKNIKTVLSLSNYSKNANCFKIKDKRQQQFRICAHSIEDKVKWVCKIQEILILPKEIACGGTVNPTDIVNNQSGKELEFLKQNFVTENVNQPLIIIPQPSRNCNENWDYTNKGNDWECQCSEGKEQSPIDLPDSNVAVSSAVKPYFSYLEFDPFPDSSTSDGNVTAGKRIRITYSNNALRIHHNNMGKVITIDGGVYIAEEIVFHTPSEHSINGERFDMEMQVIHKGKSKESIAKHIVLSILFKNKPGVHNKFIDKLDIFNLPNKLDKYREIKEKLFIPYVFLQSESANSLAFSPFSFYTYQGSISVPPCSERTIVYVAANPAPIGSTALAMFQEAIKNRDLNPDGEIEVSRLGDASNYRESQSLNGRTIFYYDHLKFCGPNDFLATARDSNSKNKRKKSGKKGHYEKHVLKSKQYFYINSETPSGLPGAYVVSENEAKGLENSF